MRRKWEWVEDIFAVIFGSALAFAGLAAIIYMAEIIFSNGI